MPTPTIRKTALPNFNKLLLDNINYNVSLAFSLRRIRSSYFGPLIKIRRSSDNLELDIPYCWDAALKEYVLCTNTAQHFIGNINLLKYSEEFNEIDWLKQNSGAVAPSRSATGISDPIGGTTAETWAFGAITLASDYSQLRQAINLIAAEHTFGVWFKAADSGSIGKKIAIYMFHSGTVERIFHTLTDQWIKVTTTDTFTAQSVSMSIATLGADRGGENQDACNVSIWGAQLNTGSVLNEYTKSGIGAAGIGYVTTWYDQSGNESHATQSNASLQPVYATDGLNSKPTIRFNQKYLENTSAKLPLILRSVFIVMNETTAVGSAGIFSVKPATGNDYQRPDAFVFECGHISTGQITLTGNSNYLMAPAGSIATGVYTEIKASRLGTLYGNGISLASDNSFSEFNAESAGGFLFGARYLNAVNYTTYGLIGDISEVVYVGGWTLPEDIRQKVEYNQSKFYGITLL